MNVQGINKEKRWKTLEERTGLQSLGIDGIKIFNWTLQNYDVTLGLDKTGSG